MPSSIARRVAIAAAVGSLGFIASAASAAVSIFPNLAFGVDGRITVADGGANGPSNPYNWIAGQTDAATPTTTNANRGIAYNPATGNVIISSNGWTVAGGTAVPAQVRVLDGTFGAIVGSLDISTATGGAVRFGGVRADANGAIYVNTINTAAGSTSNYRVHRWASEGSASSQIDLSLTYPGASGTANTNLRVGDSFDLIGSGSNTVLAFGVNNPTGGTNSYSDGYVIATTANGTTYTGTAVDFTTGPAAGDHRLGLTFLNSANNVLGTQGSGGLRNSSYSGSTGTLLNSISTGAGITERILDYIEFSSPEGTKRWLATMGASTGAGTDNGRVRIYSVNNVGTASMTLTPEGDYVVVSSGGVANGNATGQLAWGPTFSYTDAFGSHRYGATLYGLSTNNGAFSLTIQVPEPASVACLAGLAGLALSRRRA